jgi:adenylylsulfate kinase
MRSSTRRSTTGARNTWLSTRATLPADSGGGTLRCLAGDEAHGPRFQNGAMSGFTLWLTGLSGAGKSTLASEIGRLLESSGRRVEILDGDQLRAELHPTLGFSKQERDRNVATIGFIAKLLSRNDVVVIVAAVSPYREAREAVRARHTAPFVEVFVECDLTVLKARDPKGLYGRAARAELDHLTGVSDPYEAPPQPDIHIRTDRQSIQESVQAILADLRSRGLILAT